ncbi:CAP domain-containing protein [Bacillus paralicheniformis]|uniref:CAP domain-containing protein n=1 Tax=Bacillus paralicheniformis TaxID=1648923 RepID=UPI001178586F|nr:CAP domain-containing protein [Bacillus paralicheniformis]
MIKAYTVGHKIPEEIRSCISEWNYWNWIVTANTPKKNKDAKEVINKIEPDADKVAVFKNGDVDVYVSYMFPVK